MIKIARIASVLVFCACSRDSSTEHTVVRDSAGVRIVESIEPAHAPGAWQLSGTPTLSIGVVEGDAEYQFTQITGLGRLPSGEYYVAQLNNPPQVRIFDQEGRHVRSIGREGQGPGELTGIAWATALADTIQVYDFWSSRILYYGIDGAVLREIAITTLGGLPGRSISPSPGFTDGDMLARSNYLVQPDAPKGVGRSTTFLLRVAPTGELVDSFPDMPDADYIGMADRNTVIPFGRRTAVLAHDTALYVATGDMFSVDVYGSGGTLRASYRHAGDRRPVSATLIDALKAEQLANSRDDLRPRIERQFADSPIPELLPSYSRRMLIDSEGAVWVEHYLAPVDEERTWDVFDRRGAFAATISVPLQFMLRHVVGDEAIGVWTDNLDVQTVRMYEIAR